MGDPAKYFKVGLIFFLALIILGAATITIGHYNPFERTYDIDVSFPEVSGLKEGDPVRAEGLEVGRVYELKLKPGRVVATLRLAEQIELHEGYSIEIALSSLVGGRHVAIKQGNPAKPAVAMTGVLEGRSETGAFDEFRDLVAENRESVREFMRNLNAISADIKEGRGTIGRLVKDESLYVEARDTIVEVRAAVAELKKAGGIIDRVKDQLDRGEGTLAKLLTSNEVYDDLRESTGKIKELLAKAERGEGTMGKLMNDPALYDDARTLMADMRDAVASVRRITEKIDSGEGPAARLLNDKEMADKLAATVDEVKALATSLKNIAAKIERGEGSIGKLVNEDRLYEKAASTLESMDKTLGAVSRTKTYLTLGSYYYGETQMAAPWAALRLYPKPDRYFEVGGVAWPAGRNSRWDFDEKYEEDKGETFMKATALLGWEFMDNRLGLAGGLLEGKPGGRISYRVTIPWVDHDVTAIAEARDVYDDPEDLDERAGSIMIRGYVDTKVWRWFHVQAGASRIGHDAEFFAGVSFTYEDEDIRTFISLIGLAN